MKTQLEEFKILTGKDIEPFLQESVRFINTDYPVIVNFFSGNIRKVESSIIKRFTQLKFELGEIFEAFQRNKQSMEHSFYWDLLETVEEIDSKLEYLDNINRWSRSSLSSIAYTNSIRKQHTLRQNQNIERVAEEYLGVSNISDWYKIAFTNHLEEEDYDSEGGNSLVIELDRQTTTKLKVTSVVDTLYGKSIYGKDLYKKLSFSNDDLQVLDYNSTLLQAIDILISLKRNGNPDYPELGLQSQLMVGSNRTSLNFPIIERDLRNVFSTDDTLKDFQLTSLTKDQDNVLIDFQVYTRLNELQELTTTI